MVFMVFLGMTALLTRYVEKGQNSIEKERLESFAKTIQNEIYLAYKSPGQFTSKVYIPGTIDGQDFKIGMEPGSDYLYITLSGNESIYKALPNVTGDIQKGCNNITKKDGAVHVQVC